jgi:uncharacterized membrane protein
MFRASEIAPQGGRLAEGTGRIEAFSDGVFSIACTLLILELRPPVEGGLWSGLLALWPHYFALALSFFVILVTWITHHDLMKMVHGTTRSVLLANGCALFYVMFIPFPTAVLAENLGGPEVRTAAAFYCGTFVLGSAAFNLLVAAISRGQLCDAQAIARVRRGFRITFVVYLAATAIALVAPYVALAINIAVRIHLLRIRYQPAQSPP